MKLLDRKAAAMFDVVLLFLIVAPPPVVGNDWANEAPRSHGRQSREIRDRSGYSTRTLR